MTIEIITPDKTIYSGTVELAQMPCIDGLFEMLDHHAPLISILKKGKIKVINTNKETLFFEINGGVVEMLENNILVLAE